MGYSGSSVTGVWVQRRFEDEAIEDLRIGQDTEGGGKAMASMRIVSSLLSCQ